MLSLEPLLRDRIAEIPGLLGVYGLPDLIDAEKIGKPAPCAFVVYRGYQVRESSPQKRAAQVESQWLVLVAVKSAAKNADGAPARAAAQVLINAVLSKLLGWRPGAEYTPLELDSAPGPEFMAGALVFPLAFTSIHVVKGD